MPTYQYSKVTGQSFDLNLAGNKWWVPVGDVGTRGAKATVQATRSSTWGTAVLTLGRSNDKVHYHALEGGAVTLGPPASGSVLSLITASFEIGSFGWLCIDLTTVEGAAATCDIFVHIGTGV